MTRLLAVFAFLALTATAYAEVPHYTCSFNDVEVAQIDGADSGWSVEVDNDALKSAIDDAYNCNEGVDINSVRRAGDRVFFSATCWADSLGSRAVNEELSCVEDYVD